MGELIASPPHSDSLWAVGLMMEIKLTTKTLVLKTTCDIAPLSIPVQQKDTHFPLLGQPAKIPHCMV